MKNARDTLGYYLENCTALFGRESPATKFIEKKIAESPKGSTERVIADESQMVGLLMDMHGRGK